LGKSFEEILFNIFYYNIKIKPFLCNILSNDLRLIICKNIQWGLGIGDWGLGIGPIPNPQSPIPKQYYIK